MDTSTTVAPAAFRASTAARTAAFVSGLSNDVFDTNRNAVQRTAVGATGQLRVGSPGRGQGGLVRDGDERRERVLGGIGSGEEGFGQLGRRDASTAKPPPASTIVRGKLRMWFSRGWAAIDSMRPTPVTGS
jgi:hypothetical protein